MKREELLGLEISDFIERYTISDKDKIRTAKCMPNSIPDSFIGESIKPIGIGKFGGDNLPENWSANNDFTIGEYYPVYVGENDEFVVSQTTGKGMKITPNAWGLKFF